MKIVNPNLTVNTALKTADLAGDRKDARLLLREMAADLIKGDGSIRSGYLRLSTSGDGVNIRAGHVGAGATAATDLVKKLVLKGYGPQARQALDDYLQAHHAHKPKVGTLSFVKLVQALEADTAPLRRHAVDAKINNADARTAASGGRLNTDGFDRMTVDPQAAGDLRDYNFQPAGISLNARWQRGLETLFGPGNVRLLHNSGGEGSSFEIQHNGQALIYKAFTEANPINPSNADSARERNRPNPARQGDVGLSYSSGLQASPHVVAPIEYVIGVGSNPETLQTILKVPADRIKELAQQAGRGQIKPGLFILGVVTPKVQGHSLDQHPGAFTNHHLGQIAKGMHAALSDFQAHNAVHNDIKLHNTMFNPADGSARLIDFGQMAKLKKRPDPAAEPGAPAEPNHLRAAIGSVGYGAPWLNGQSRFGPEADRYSFGITMLAALVKEAQVQGQDEAQNQNPDPDPDRVPSHEALPMALARFKRPAERGTELLPDLLKYLEGRDKSLHDQVQAKLADRPQLRDFLQTVFASSLPGPQANKAWDGLVKHPITAAARLREALANAGLHDAQSAQQRAQAKMALVRSVPMQDWRKFNEDSASPLLPAVHRNPRLLDPALSDAQRKALYLEFENIHFNARLDKIRNEPYSEGTSPADRDEAIESNITDARNQRARIIELDLAQLNDRSTWDLMSRTAVAAGQAGLSFNEIDTIGRSQENYNIITQTSDVDLTNLVNKVFSDQELTPQDLRMAKHLLAFVD